MQGKLEIVDVEQLELVDVEQLVDENKEDWKGRKALKFRYGGMGAAVLVLGNE